MCDSEKEKYVENGIKNWGSKTNFSDRKMESAMANADNLVKS